jgi:uncharacterized protein (TIGR02453 family)
MPFFTPATLRFFTGLREHNSKPWFEAHRGDYERHVKEPIQALVAAMDARFARFAPEIGGDPRKSVFRIHRDIRFSKDKSPYKTHVAAWFFHRGAHNRVGQESEGGSAGFYVHVSPGESFLGGGMWMPPRTTLERIRAAIAADPRGFAKVVASPAVRKRFGGLSEESMLKRMPRGYAEDHAAAQWLRHQSFTLGRRMTDKQATSATLPALLEADYALLLPLVRWLNAALGLKPAKPAKAKAR